MQQTLPANVTNHYRRNKKSYEGIEQRLSETRGRFLSSDRSDQIEMLQKSHSFAVISVQTPVHIHEEGFKNLWSSDDMSKSRILEAIKSVNYNVHKSEYIIHSLENEQLWDQVCDLLENNQIDTAHRFILDNFKGVGPVKAPFVLSMLGFVEKMCVDTNIVNAFELDGHPTTVVVDKYEEIVSNIRDKLPTLKKMTTPFMFQWIVFDYQRGEISTHDVFYQII